jgi:hypothetical protein
MDTAFDRHTTMAVGLRPRMPLSEWPLFAACQGDGSAHVIDLATRRVVHRFDAGWGRETPAFF